MALCYYSVLNFNNRRRYWMLFILAVFFHYTSLFIFPLFALLRLKFQPRTRLILGILVVISSYYLSSALSVLVEFLPLGYYQQKFLTYTLESRSAKFKINFMGIFFVAKFILFPIPTAFGGFVGYKIAYFISQYLTAYIQ